MLADDVGRWAKVLGKWRARQDSNLRPLAPEAKILPVVHAAIS